MNLVCLASRPLDKVRSRSLEDLRHRQPPDLPVDLDAYWNLTTLLCSEDMDFSFDTSRFIANQFAQLSSEETLYVRSWLQARISAKLLRSREVESRLRELRKFLIEF